MTAILERDQSRPPAADGPPPTPGRGRSRGWRKPTRNQLIVAAIGALAAALYTWGLSRTGMGNSYYAAAVRSGATSWKAFFFGSIDPGSFITVDKPPAALWVMSLSARIFGFSSWSMLLPEAAAGVGSVLILHRLVRKWAGDVSAHLAALAFAVTPVAVVMFRYNNPDAFLTLLCLGSAWALWSALETGRTRGLLLGAALLGLAFDTKMLQAFLVLPAMALVYLIAGPPKLARRLLQLAAAGAVLMVSAGWWVLAVLLWPTASRPYIGSTSNNSILSLIFGYNGLSRIFGSSGPGPGAGGGRGGGGGGGGGGGAGFGGAAGLLRLFNGENGGQVGWLIPLAVAGLLAGLWLTRRGRRTDRGRAGWILWGGWAAVSAAVFSLSQGIFHPYYSVQLAPAIAALAGAGAVALWHLGRRSPALGWVLPTSIVVTAAVAVEILDRTPNYHPELRAGIAVGAALAAAGLLAAMYLRHARIMVFAAALAGASLLAAPAAFALTTATSSANGPTPAAGPSNGTGFGGAGGAVGAGGTGGFGGSTATSPALISYLETNRRGAQYLVAAFGSQSSAPIIIASGQPVMTIGGFNGGDPAPTLAQFEQLVAGGKVRYILISAGGRGGGFGGGPGGGTSSAISTWVTTHGKQVSYGDTSAGTLYQLS
ncbi:MAG: glycosyltransferase family 39 protein [Actinomycetota bacterium]|nr:glycosyltransferase family 39 protein [Actinomycetota bacterium]